MTTERWTDQDFDGMSWHDNHVHALRLIEGENGSGELVLSLDYILEWLPAEKGFQFRIVPAELRFLEVSDLNIAISYAASSAAMGPFCIASVKRQSIPRAHYVAQCWTIGINWPGGEISFEARGFEQSRRGLEVLSSSQGLNPAERGDA